MKTHDPLYRRHRFPAEVIANAVWLYFRFPLSLRMVEDMLAMRGIVVSHETVRSGLPERRGQKIALQRQLPNLGVKRFHVNRRLYGITFRACRAPILGSYTECNLHRYFLTDIKNSNLLLE